MNHRGTGLMWLLVAAYAVAFAVVGQDTQVVVDEALGLVAVAVIAALAWSAVRGDRLRTGRTSAPLALAASGVSAFALGLYAYAGELLLHGRVGFPAVGDVGYLLFYPLLLTALLLLVRRHVSDLGGIVLVDMANGILAVTSVLSVVLGPAVRPMFTDGAGLAAVVSIAYPVLDLVLVVALLGLVVVRGLRVVRGWPWLIGGLATFAATDVVLALWVTASVEVVGSPLQVGWGVGLALVTQWVVVSARAEQGPAHREPLPDRPTVSAPASAGGATLAGLAVLIAGTQGALSPLSVVLAGLTMLGLGVRTQVAFRQLVRDADLRTLAVTDDLTGLPNRRAFYTDATGRLTADPARPRALLLLDLDRFKEVNDGLGHHVGDRLLVEVGHRLRAALRPDDLLARLGGDEFVALLNDVDEDGAREVADAIAEVLAPPVPVEGAALSTSASVGIAVLPEHGTTLSTALRRADIAMYRAKADATGHVVFRPEHDDLADHGSARMQRVAELRTALVAGEMVLHYQPKVDLVTGEVVGAEALVRWAHPVHGLLGPDQFLDLVEDCGLMPALTRTVLGLALDRVLAWRRDGHRLGVAVNLSPSSLVEEGLPDLVLTMLAARGLPPAALHLEITEEILVRDRDRAAGILARLRTSGVTIALDDFGVGYSSLAYLRDLPIDEIKLDRTFVQPMATDPRAGALVSSTIALAHNLDLRIVAEGVEDPATCTALARLGCDLVQGFHVTRPLPADELAAWLAAGAVPSRPHGALPAQASARTVHV